ncbi:MAG: hypothetical protein V3T31_10570 [candidate division Zixibacteria bacterium]
MTPARFRWGLLFILIGVLILIDRMYPVSHEFGFEILAWSPVLLIAIGIEKIFTRSRMEFISYLSSVALFAGAIFLVIDNSSDGADGSYFKRTTYYKKYDPSVSELHAVLDIGDADLTIRDATDDMVFGRFAQFTRKPKITYDIEGDRASVEFDYRRNRFLGGAVRFETGEASDWTLKFSEDVPLYLSCSAEDADIHLNMATTPMRELDIEAPNTILYLKIGDLVPEVSITLVGDESEVRLRVPRQAALQISGDDYESYLKRLGLVERNGVYVSQNYEVNLPKIVVDLDKRLRSLNIDTY